MRTKILLLLFGRKDLVSTLGDDPADLFSRGLRVHQIDLQIRPPDERLSDERFGGKSRHNPRVNDILTRNHRALLDSRMWFSRDISAAHMRLLLAT